MFSHVSHVAQDHTKAEQFIQHWALLTPDTTLRSATCSWVMLRFDVPPPCATMVVPPAHHIVPSRFATMVVPPAHQPWFATTLYHHGGTSLSHCATMVVPPWFATTLHHNTLYRHGLPPSHVMPPRCAPSVFHHILPPRFSTPSCTTTHYATTVCHQVVTSSSVMLNNSYLPTLLQRNPLVYFI